MSDETRQTKPEGPGEERRSGQDRRRGAERRQEDRGIWSVPVLKRLIDRRKGGDRRSGTDRRQD